MESEKYFKTLRESDPLGYKEMKLELQAVGLELIAARKRLEMPDDQELNNGVKNII